MINYGRQNITQEDIDAVVKALKSDWLTQGPLVSAFERKFSERIHAKYASAVNNGTSALHLAAISAGIQKGDCWLTTPITFVATANSVLYCGGNIDFVDIDPKSLTIDLNQLEDKLKTGKYKGVLPVDFAGYPVRIDLINEMAQKFGVKIIEDACHAPGAWFLDKSGKKIYAGSCEYSDLAVFSFHPVKHIAMGEGGMVTTNSKEFDDKIKVLRTHGIVRDEGKLSENHGGWYMEMQELGYNYRIPDILCALGISQLDRLDESIERRNEIALAYSRSFESLPINSTIMLDGIRHAYHLYVIQTERRNELYDHLKGNGILPQVHYIPIHLMPFYRKMGFNKGDFPNSENYYNKGMSLPMYPTLNNKELSSVIAHTCDFFNQ